MSKGFEESKYGYLRYISLKSLVERDNLPGFLSSYLTKKKLTFEKKFCGWLFLIRVQKKKCHKESWNRYTMRHFFDYLCISFTKTTRQKSHSFFFVSLLKSQAQNETIWAWDFVKINVMPTDGLVLFTKGCVKGSAGLCKGGVHCATHRCRREFTGGFHGVHGVKFSHMKSSGHPSPSWSSWRRALVPAWSDCLGLRTLELTLIHESVLRSSSVVVGTIEAT